MSAVEVFQFPATGGHVRTVVRNGEPWFIAADVCHVLGYGGGARNAVARLPERMKGVAPVNTPGGEQQLTVLNEAGAYRLVMRSTLPTAEAFQDWLAEEVIPAIRRTGRYELAQLGDPLDEIELANERTARAVAIARQERTERLAAEARVAELAPAAAQAEHFRQAEGLASVASFCNDLQLWAQETHGVRLVHEEIRDFLGDIRLIIRSSGIRKNEPYGEAIKAGYVRPKHSTYDTNTRGSRESTSTRLTPKGWGYAWDRAVRRIAEHGSLKPVASVATRSP